MPDVRRAVGTRVAGIGWRHGAPVIIDQRRLPGEILSVRLETVDAVIDAIRTLAVRGAPAIGIAGAYGVALAAGRSTAATPGALRAEIDAHAERIGAARPTAVNLALATARVARAVRAAPDDLEAIRTAALDEARAIHEEDAVASEAIGRHGAAYLAGTRRILTHCNTGRLATGGDGTALGDRLRAARSGSRSIESWRRESRPLLQGGRLTAWELTEAGVPTRLIVDFGGGRCHVRAVSSTRSSWAAIGSPRTATPPTRSARTSWQSSLATTGSRSIVAGPRSSFDAQTPDGAAIVVEERAADEVRGFGGTLVAPADVGVWNPAFDVTPAALIDGFITEAGVSRPRRHRERSPSGGIR